MKKREGREERRSRGGKGQGGGPPSPHVGPDLAFLSRCLFSALNTHSALPSADHVLRHSTAYVSAHDPSQTFAKAGVGHNLGVEEDQGKYGGSRTQ